MAIRLSDYESSNIRHTWFLFGIFFLVVIGLGWVFSQIYGDPSYILYGLIFSIVYSLVSYFASAKIALSLARAVPIKREDNPALYDIVKNIAQRSSLPMPALYTTPEMQINAFATGRNPENAAVAVTKGALLKLNQPELEGVLAHELSHVKNGDILVSTVAAILAGIISLVADIFLRSAFFGANRKEGEGLFAFGIILSILAPIGTMLIQLAISRKRESLADASGVEIIHNREGLISALEKIEADTTPMLTAKNSTAHMWIENPFKGTNAWWHNMFSTHPPIGERIAALKRLAV